MEGICIHATTTTRARDGVVQDELAQDGVVTRRVVDAALAFADAMTQAREESVMAGTVPVGEEVARREQAARRVQRLRDTLRRGGRRDRVDAGWDHRRHRRLDARRAARARGLTRAAATSTGSASRAPTLA